MLLKLKNIGKIYNSNDILTIGIRGINLELDYNEFVTIEGESGSGKSTLLNVIGANDSYEEGELYLNSSETSHYSESEWEKYREKNIATIFQDFNIIENLTVLENVELALLRLDDKRERRRIAKELIEKVGLEKQANQRGSKLSGGEKQRTVIARALAKDAPIILADEPTGNLDVKSSREVAKLLKDVSKDKLVIVVTHNPEFFAEYATRRITVYDGTISEDRVIAKPAPKESAEKQELPPSRRRNLLNTLQIGCLNYKSRPKFTAMMSLALAVCAVTLFLVIALFGQSLIQPLTATLDGTEIVGKVIVSSEGEIITADELDAAANETGASYIFPDRSLSKFEVTIPRSSGMLQAYTVTCLYAPFEYNPQAGKAVLVIPQSQSGDASSICSAFLNSGVGLTDIETVTQLAASGVRLYLSYHDLIDHGVKIGAINSYMTLGDTQWPVYTFESGSDIGVGEVKLVNSSAYEATKYSAVFSVNSSRSYQVVSVSEKREDVSGLIVRMNESDYSEIFESGVSQARQAVLYFDSDDTAGRALEHLPDGMLGMLSSSGVYVQNAGLIYANNIMWYLALIGVCLLFAALISIIFGRSVKIFQTDFAVYRTLGISSRISSRSLYIQMLLIFLPTLLLLPLVSFIATAVPGSSLAFISVGNYLFIELMLLLIVELVAFGFNKSLRGKSIRSSLKRGSK